MEMTYFESISGVWRTINAKRSNPLDITLPKSRLRLVWKEFVISRMSIVRSYLFAHLSQVCLRLLVVDMGDWGRFELMDLVIEKC